MSTSSVKVDINVATKAADIALKKFETNLKQVDKTWDIFKGNLAAQLTLKGLQGAFSSITSFTKEIINAASEAEQSSKNLSIALNNVGLSSQSTFKDLAEYADSLEKVSSFSAEAIQDSMALTAQLTTLDKNGIKQAAQSAVDLAATLNIDLRTANDLIIRGINGQTTAFKRYGLEVKAGADSAQNLANILAATSKFQGAAEKQTQTFAGAQTQLVNAYGKIHEELGKLITQNPAVIGGMNALTKIFMNTANWIKDNSENILLFGKSLLIAATAVTGTFIVSMGLMNASVIASAVSFGTLSAAAKIAWATVTGPVGLAVVGITALTAALFVAVKYWDDIKIKTLEATAAVLDYAARAAGVFSKSTSDGLREQANELRNQAQAAREAKIAIEDESNATKLANEAAETAARADQERHNQKLARLEDDKKFTLQLIAESENKQKIAQDELAQLQSNSDLEREILKAQYDQGALDYFEYQAKLDEIDAQYYEQRKAIIATQADEELMRVQAARENGLISIEQFNEAKLALERKSANQINILDNDQKKKRIKTEEEVRKEKKRINEMTLSETANMFGSLAGLAEQGGKKFFQISKALNIAQITLSGIQHVMRASELPFPANIPAMIAAGVTAATNLSKAKSAQPSFAGGGVVGGFQGSSMGVDNVQANVRTGEMILNARQQRTLFDIASQGNGTSNDLIGAVNTLISVIQAQPIIVNIGGRTIVETLRDELSTGRTFE